MSSVRQQSPSRKLNSTTCRVTARYSLEQARRFATKQKRRFGQYRGNYPRGAETLVENSGFTFPVRSCLEKLFRAVITYCLQQTEHGYLKLEDLRATLKGKGVSRSNVTTYVARMTNLGLIMHITSDVYRIRFYNCGTQKRQDKLVQDLNSRLAKKVTNLRVYEEPKRYTSGANAPRVSDLLAAPLKTKTKNTLSTTVPASTDGIGPHIMPAAKQGRGHKAVVVPHEMAQASPAKLLSPKPEEAHRDALAINEMLASKLPRGFKIPDLGQSIVARRKDPELERNDRPAVSEAEARGHRQANIEQRERGRLTWQKTQSKQARMPLAPISDTTASFLENCYRAHDRASRESSANCSNVLARPRGAQVHASK